MPFSGKIFCDTEVLQKFYCFDIQRINAYFLAIMGITELIYKQNGSNCYIYDINKCDSDGAILGSKKIDKIYQGSQCEFLQTNKTIFVKLKKYLVSSKKIKKTMNW